MYVLESIPLKRSGFQQKTWLILCIAYLSPVCHIFLKNFTLSFQSSRIFPVRSSRHGFGSYYMFTAECIPLKLPATIFT